MGGSWKKPAGHTIVPEAGVLLLLPDDSSVTKVGQRLVHTYLKSLLKVPGLGRSSSSQLATRGILTLGQLRKASLEEVRLITVGSPVSLPLVKSKDLSFYISARWRELDCQGTFQSG